MSSTGSGAIAEPSWPLADRLALASIVACAASVEATAARHPDAPMGLGMATGMLLLAWLVAARRRRVRLQFAPECDGPPTCVDGGDAVCVHANSRVLGRSVVLHWKTPQRSGRYWYTRADLPQPVLRRLRTAVRRAGRVKPR
jgi:hypothetical protein